LKVSIAANGPAIGTAIVVLALLAACGGAPATPTVAPTPTLEPTPTTEPTATPVSTPTATAGEFEPVAEGWELHTLEDARFALSIPPGWQAFDMDAETLEQGITALKEANPTYGEMLSAQLTSLITQGVEFYALDLDSPSIAQGLAANLNVIRMSVLTKGDVEAMLPLMSAQVKGQLGDTLGGEIELGVVKSGSGHKLGRLTYNSNFNLPDGGAVALHMTQYIAITDGGMYIISCTAPADYEEDYATTFEMIAEGLYFLD
jgi:hypothetical protein